MKPKTSIVFTKLFHFSNDVEVQVYTGYRRNNDTQMTQDAGLPAAIALTFSNEFTPLLNA